MDREELKLRTKVFAVRIVKMAEALPRTRAADIIARQILRSATSVGANYRAACRSRSHKEFVARIAIVEEEADETLYWLEILVEASIMPDTKLGDLIQEARELTAIFTATRYTASQNQ
ncbi:MAG: four helix bundle protein [Anaerolineae bacterium]|nr:four helix bundle protein [Anaerolineae bacterium]